MRVKLPNGGKGLPRKIPQKDGYAELEDLLALLPPHEDRDQVFPEEFVIRPVGQLVQDLLGKGERQARRIIPEVQKFAPIVGTGPKRHFVTLVNSTSNFAETYEPAKGGRPRKELAIEPPEPGFMFEVVPQRP